MVAAWAKAVSIKTCLKKIFENFCNFLFSPHFFPMLRRPKILKAELRQWKCMMIVALWKKQILTYEILPYGVTVDNVVYLNFLERRVLPEVNKKKFGRPIILHNNAKPHKHRIVTEHTSLGISMLPDRWRAIHLANGKYVE